MCLHAPMKALFGMEAKRYATGASWALECAEWMNPYADAVRMTGDVLLTTKVVGFIRRR